MQKRVIQITCVLLTLVFAFVWIFHRSSADNENILNSFYSVQHNFTFGYTSAKTTTYMVQNVIDEETDPVQQAANNSASSPSMPGIGPNASWIQCVNTMAQWYVDHVSTYSAGKSLGTPSAQAVAEWQPAGYEVDSANTGRYVCDVSPIFANCKIRDDCSGFVSACLRLYFQEEAFTVFGSSNFAPGGSVDQKLEGRGQFLNANDVGVEGLRAGDVLCRHGHVEVVMVPYDASTGKVGTWGWGSMKPNTDPGGKVVTSVSGGLAYLGNTYPYVLRIN